MADAGHNLSDVLGLALAWGASYLSIKKPSSRFSYGLKSTSILAALLNAVFLLLAVGGIIWESIQRILTPTSVDAGIVMVVAAVGIVIIAGTFNLLKESVNLSLHGVPKEIDLNEVRGFFENHEDVIEAHDLHIWAMSTTDTALTCHLVMDEPHVSIEQCKLAKILQLLKEKYHIDHSTVQVDWAYDVSKYIKD